ALSSCGGCQWLPHRLWRRAARQAVAARARAAARRVAVSGTDRGTARPLTVVGVLRRLQAFGDQRLDRVGAAVEQVVQLLALRTGELPQHVVGRILLTRWSADPNARPGVLPAAQ